jgi:hypothetical protein
MLVLAIVDLRDAVGEGDCEAVEHTLSKGLRLPKFVLRLGSSDCRRDENETFRTRGRGDR